MRPKLSSRSASKLTLGRAKIIEAPSEFLDETTETLRRWRYLSMKVAFNGLEQRAKSNMQSPSEGYQAGIWIVLEQASEPDKQVAKARFREGLQEPRRPIRSNHRDLKQVGWIKSFAKDSHQRSALKRWPQFKQRCARIWSRISRRRARPAGSSTATNAAAFGGGRPEIKLRSNPSIERTSSGSGACNLSCAPFLCFFRCALEERPTF